jgi:hypothetical protein
MAVTLTRANDSEFSGLDRVEHQKKLTNDRLEFHIEEQNHGFG